jgi:hypothetical protein
VTLGDVDGSVFGDDEEQALDSVAAAASDRTDATSRDVGPAING